MTTETYNLIYKVTASVYFANSLREVDLEDIVQEVALRVHKAELKGEEIVSLPAFVRNIARRTLIDQNRRKRLTVNESSLGEYALGESQATTAESDAQYIVELRDLYDVYLHRAGKDEALLSRLYFDLHLTHDQIASVLDVSLSTVKRRIPALIAKLRQMADDEVSLLA